MAAITPDISSRLRPELISVVRLILVDVSNLQPGEKVLIITDSRTPDHVVAVFQGVAQSLGAEAVRIECRLPKGGATYQPGSSWPSMLKAAAAEANLIVDMAVGYADFIIDGISRGTRVICPGDGIGSPFMEDTLIRTMLHADIHAIRRHADRIAARFTAAKHCEIHTGKDVFTVDLTDVEGAAGDGFLWDADKGAWKSPWAFLPPAQPGVLVPLGRGDGTVNVDGTLLYHPDYHEKPDSPLRLTFKRGRLTAIGGDPYLAARLENWLGALGDDGAYNGPVHINIGNNPNALLTQSQEWERVYGSITCGMGDLSMLSRILGKEMRHALSRSSVHWDWTVLQPKIILDGRVIAEKGRIFCDD
ncbi:MAG: hypothetical protein FJY55_11245 [Betaproteobacteria bacterium]|nr:hypothetical protein [Betaproteobacteria bacterium]